MQSYARISSILNSFNSLRCYASKIHCFDIKSEMERVQATNSIIRLFAKYTYNQTFCCYKNMQTII